KSTYLISESAQFTATPLDASGNAVTGAAAATWESSTPSVATVGADGTVRAVAEGSSTIRATIGSINATRSVTVLAAGVGAVVIMPGLSFAPSTVTIANGKAVFFDFPPLGHNVLFTQKPGVPQDIQVTANVTVSRTFATAGSFLYECTIHAGMRGEVVVTP
ncbi:MAG: Ig-like domain-containing protein, partial [Gemmatimonadaceae bacterium]